MRIRIRITPGLASRIRIRIEIKSWIRIRIKANADLQHCNFVSVKTGWYLKGENFFPICYLLWAGTSSGTWWASPAWPRRRILSRGVRAARARRWYWPRWGPPATPDPCWDRAGRCFATANPATAIAMFVPRNYTIQTPNPKCRLFFKNWPVKGPGGGRCLSVWEAPWGGKAIL